MTSDLSNRRSTDHRHFMRLGMVAVNDEDFERAVEWYQRALDLEPGMAEGWNLMGLVLDRQRQYRRSQRCFQKALEISPTYLDALCNLGKAYLADKKTKPAIACYRKANDIDPNRVDTLIQLGKLYKIQHDFIQALRYFEAALKLEPDCADLLNLIGDIYKTTGQYDVAEKHFMAAVAIDPDQAAVLFNLAVIAGESGEAEKAIEWYRRVLALKPASKASLYNLSIQYAAINHLDEAVRAIRRVLAIDPNHAEAHNNLGNYYRKLGNIDASIFHHQRAIEIDPRLAHPHLNLALAQLLSGDFHQGWQEYEWRFHVDVYQSEYRYIDDPIWDGQPFDHKTLLVYDEQGMGDTFQFIRYLPMVKRLGGTVVFETRESILPLIRGFPGVDDLIQRPEKGKTDHPYDMCIPLMSVPGKMGTTLESIPASVPYIFPLPDKRDPWSGRLGSRGMKIGIVWAGSRRHINDVNRSCTVDQFEGLARIPDISVFSLQKEISARERAALDRLGIDDLGQAFVDFADTAAVIDQLDLIISVDTSVVHLAGAMGKPVWVLLPFDPDWRWLLHTSKSPWYPTLSLFRQSGPGDWNSVMSAVSDKLKTLVLSHRPGEPA